MKIGNPCNWVANTHHYFLQGDLQYTNYHGVTNQVFLAYLLASGKKKFSMFRTIMFTLLPLLDAQVVEKYSYFISGGCILFFTSNDVIFLFWLSFMQSVVEDLASSIIYKMMLMNTVKGLYLRSLASDYMNNFSLLQLCFGSLWLS